jgi:hypothetical protein
MNREHSAYEPKSVDGFGLAQQPGLSNLGRWPNHKAGEARSQAAPTSMACQSGGACRLGGVRISRGAARGREESIWGGGGGMGGDGVKGLTNKGPPR